MADPAKVFEVVDATGDEMYFPLGIWLTLEEALGAIEACNDPSDLPSERDDSDFACTVEVREHRIGWGGIGKTVAKIEWRERYDEDADEFRWERTTECSSGVKEATP